MKVSVGIMAHNEEKNINRTLNSVINQKLDRVRIDEIIVVSSGSTDKTNDIIRKFSRRDNKIKLIEEQERTGKANAINIFLGKSRNDNLVLISGDVVPEVGTVEVLCSRLVDTVGVVVGRPVPKNVSGILGGVVDLEWRIHHELSLNKPKLGEMIVFRKVFDQIGRTAVDEEFIGMLIERAGFRSMYVPDAIVNNTGPKTIKDFIKQRRRIYSGHLELSRLKHNPVSLSNVSVLRGFKRLGGDVDIVITAFILESVSRFLGFCDFLLNKNKHAVWDMIRR